VTDSFSISKQTNTKNMLYLFNQELFFNPLCEHNLDIETLL